MKTGRKRLSTLLIPLFIALFTALFTALFAGGIGPPATRQARFFASEAGYMDTVLSLTAYTDSAARFDAVFAALRQCWAELDDLFNIHRTDSAVSRLHQSGERDMPDAFWELVERCRQRQAGGVNIAMGSVITLWERARETGALPTEAAIHAAMEHTQLDTLARDGNTARLTDPAMRLDPGAVAKGYAAQQLAEQLWEQGITDFLLNAGSSTLVCSGRPPGTAGWRVAIRHPDSALNLSGDPDPPALLGTLVLTDTAMSISGDYQKYFVCNGTYYSHILSAETGRPAQDYRMVCVLTPRADDADYYSTALFALPYARSREAAEQAAAKGLSLEVLWMLADGHIYTTAGFPDWEPATSDNESR